MAKRPKLRLVGSEPASVFDNLETLREAQRNARPQRRSRITETFARIPHDRALELYRHIGGSPWAVLVELDRLILKGRGLNPVEFPNTHLRREFGMDPRTRKWALQQLEAAGVVRVAWRGERRPPLVLHLWYPRQA